MLGTSWLDGPDKLHEEYGLESPLRQSYYLLGLMLNVSEPSDAKDFGREELKNACELASKIYLYYVSTFFNESDETKLEDDALHERVLMSASIFIDYFNRPRLMGTHEQIRRKLKLNFAPLDRELCEVIGVSASDLLEIIDFLGKTLQFKMDKSIFAFGDMKKIHKQWIAISKRDGIDVANKFMRQNALLHTPIMNEFQSSMNDVNVIKYSEIETKFGSKLAEAFWSLAVSIRGREKSIIYPTDRNVAEYKSLFQVDEDSACCPIINSVTMGIIQSLDERLSTSKYAGRYYKNRDKTLEREGRVQFEKLFKETPMFYESVFEYPDSHFEHDLIIVDNTRVLIIEAKASRMREPLRDPMRTFERMRDSFRGDGGIQKAYSQGFRIKSQLDKGIDVPLYTSKGMLAGTLKADEISESFIICLTGEALGFLATDLSLFLEKAENEPFPWAVNILDLELFVEGIKYRGWNSSQFYQYLRERAKIHGKVRSEDELAFAGAYLHNGDLKLGQEDSQHITLSHDFASIFDDIWRNKIDGSPVVFKPKKVFTNLNRALGIPDAKGPISWRPDRRCFCGSGRKYKNCCFKDGRLFTKKEPS